jgi:hypothetical protein
VPTFASSPRTPSRRAPEIVPTPRFDPLPSRDEARAILQDLGVPSHHAGIAAQRDDVVVLSCALDRLGALCGRRGLSYFLTRPHPHLAWQSPAEVLGGTDGVSRVRSTVEFELRFARSRLSNRAART